MSIDPNSPLFIAEKPFLEHPEDTPNGLTIRAYFAAMAMKGLTSNSTITQYIAYANTHDDQAFKLTAIKAVALADALIAELNKTAP